MNSYNFKIQVSIQNKISKVATACAFKSKPFQIEVHNFSNEMSTKRYESKKREV